MIEAPDSLKFFQLFEHREESNTCAVSIEDLLVYSKDDHNDTSRYFIKSEVEPISKEPLQFVSSLFEDNDILEIRVIPSLIFKPKVDIFFGYANETSQMVNYLADRNREISACNIYISANPRANFWGSSKSNIKIARSVFVDFDKISSGEALKKIRRFPKPSIVVESGHGVHIYWRLKDPITDLHFWTDLQKLLSKELGSDGSVCDPARIMRLPGFNNVKTKHVPCRIIIENKDSRCDLQDLLKCLPAFSKAVEVKTKTKSTTTAIVDERRQSDIATLARAKEYAARFSIVDNNRNSTLFARACSLFENFNLTNYETHEIISNNNADFLHPLEDTEVAELVKNANKSLSRNSVSRGKYLNFQAISEPYTSPSTPIITLEDWRQQLEMRRIENQGKPGVFFDGSPTGAGKTTADIALIKKSRTSLTLLPTHHACEELEKILVSEGIDAAAFPKLDDSTCEIYSVAKKAQEAGLSVGKSVCPTCEFFSKCEYQKKRSKARIAPHSIATHFRAALSGFEQGKEVIFIHEDPLSLMRPYVKILSHHKSKKIEQLTDLEDIKKISDELKNVGNSWSDTKLVEFATDLKQGTEELIGFLKSTDLIDKFEEALANGMPTNELESVRQLPTRLKAPIPENFNFALKRAMDQSRIYSKGNVLRLALGYAFGQIESLCAYIGDDYKEDAGKDKFYKVIIGCWATPLPKNTQIWFEDASSSINLIQELTGLDVLDQTPCGRLKNQSEPLQFPLNDVKQSTAKQTIRALMRGLMVKYKDKKRFGVISHLCHKETIEKLDLFWRKRITMIEHYRSGKDRASNSWLSCDLLIVLGTPRVPAAAIKEMLIRLGKITEANLQLRFVSFAFEGKTTSGKIVAVQNKGYESVAWKQIYNHLVKEAIRQAVGRARSVTSSAVPVVVLSNENLGYELSECETLMITDSLDETLRAMLPVSVNHPYNYILGEMSAKSLSVRQIRDTVPDSKKRTHRRDVESLRKYGVFKPKGRLMRDDAIFEDWLIDFVD